MNVDLVQLSEEKIKKNRSQMWSSGTQRSVAVVGSSITQVLCFHFSILCCFMLQHYNSEENNVLFTSLHSVVVLAADPTL